MCNIRRRTLRLAIQQHRKQGIEGSLGRFFFLSIGLCLLSREKGSLALLLLILLSFIIIIFFLCCQTQNHFHNLYFPLNNSNTFSLFLFFKSVCHILMLISFTFL